MTYHMTPLPTHMSCNWCQFISRLAVFSDPWRVERTSNDGEWHFRLGKRSPCYSLHYKCFLFMRDTMKLTYITYASSIFSPAKIEWNGIQLLLSQRRVFLSFSFFLMRIWVLCKLCHNEISCTFHHVALCWRIKQMVNWFSGNCSKIKKTGNHCFSVTLLDKITQTKHYLKCYFKSAVYYFISISL